MWGAVLNLVGGGLVREVGGQINAAIKTRANAKNATERIDADKEMASLQATRAVLVAEARSSWNVIFRVALAAPFMVFVWKVIIWDKVLRLGVTDDLSPDLWNLMMVVYGFYFVYETATLFKR